jgi:hypothetical protein
MILSKLQKEKENAGPSKGLISILKKKFNREQPMTMMLSDSPLLLIV